MQLPLGIRLREGLDFESFYGGPNAELVAMARGLARGEGPHSLFIWAGPGSGKTHLLQALCAYAGSGSAYLPLAELISLSPEILEGLSRVRLLCLDDVDALCANVAWEQALVVCLDRLRQAGGRLVVAARRAPDALQLGLKDLRSRLGWGLVYGLQPLSDDDKRTVLQLRAERRGLHMPDEVASYLLTRHSRDLLALLALLDRLDRASLAAKRRLTVPFTRQVLAESAAQR